MVRVQICIALLLTSIGVPAVFAQTAAEIDPGTSQLASLLAPNTGSTRPGVAKPDANGYPAASKEGEPTALESAQKSFRAGLASLDARQYKDAVTSLEAARRLSPELSSRVSSALQCLPWSGRL